MASTSLTSFGHKRITKGSNGDIAMEARNGAGRVREKSAVGCMVHWSGRQGERERGREEREERDSWATRELPAAFLRIAV